VRDLAERFAVSHPTIYRWVRLGKLPAIRLGKRVLRFSEDEILSWEEARHTEANDSGEARSQRKPRLKPKTFFAP
ncbi:MAG TPA: helix-turn-helix domain-containing protein, partial [Chthoniobacterales bacterium]|nr:helix-turn-helix domain-containing protein [Chthoniobacterales bacterium]